MRCGSRSTSSCTHPPTRMAWKCSSGSLETRRPPPSGSWSLEWSTSSVCSPSWRTRRAFQSAPGWPHVSAQNPSWQSQLPPACPVHNPPPPACYCLTFAPQASGWLHTVIPAKTLESSDVHWIKKKKSWNIVDLQCWFLPYGKVIQLYTHTHTYIYIHFFTAYWIFLKTLITC